MLMFISKKNDQELSHTSEHSHLASPLWECTCLPGTALPSRALSPHNILHLHLLHTVCGRRPYATPI